jgi:hypothetical protein
MHSRNLMILGAAAWLLAGNAAFAEETGMPTNNDGQKQISSEAADDSDHALVESGTTVNRVRNGGPVEHRRNDRGNMKAGGNGASSRSSGKGGKSGNDSGGGGDGPID